MKLPKAEIRARVWWIIEAAQHVLKSVDVPNPGGAMPGGVPRFPGLPTALKEVERQTVDLRSRLSMGDKPLYTQLVPQHWPPPRIPNPKEKMLLVQDDVMWVCMSAEDAVAEGEWKRYIYLGELPESGASGGH